MVTGRVDLDVRPSLNRVKSVKSFILWDNTELTCSII
nr:MAG TPA: hypothetical protein [Caudoviricetes sp.]